MRSPTEHRRWFLRVVPIAWAVLGFLSLQNPGDEYMLFALAALPGLWIALLQNIGDVHTAAPVVLLAGAVACVGLGWLLDRLHASPGLWLGVVVVTTVVLTVAALSGFDSYDAAMRKNGSLSAYAFAAASLGVQLATVLGLMQGLLRPLWSGVRAQA